MKNINIINEDILFNLKVYFLILILQEIKIF